MIIQVLHCPYCQGTDIVRHGKSPEGKQRYRCRQCLEARGRTFLLDYKYLCKNKLILLLRKNQHWRRMGARAYKNNYAQVLSYAGQSPAVKEQIVDMAMNASGIRDTARVLKISPTTVISELKKKNLHSKR
jgi:transposase-like protein